MPDRPRLAFSRHVFPHVARPLFALSLALAPAVVRAEEPSHAAAAGTQDDTQRAKELFQQGTTLFNLGEFDKAIEAWQEGYKQKSDPGFLYNIGQAYRLKGDAGKAIFFYRGYLRTSPRAANRAEIEAKIAALQKESSEPKAAVAPSPTTTTAPPPVTPSPAPRVAPPPVEPVPVAPPPAAAPPLAGTTTAAPEAPAPMSEPPPAASGSENRPWDLGVGMGFDAWASAEHGSAQPSFGLDLAAGYAFGGDVTGPASFRLGVLYTYSFLSEPKSKVSFNSFFVEPSVRLRLSDRRWYLVGALGVGRLGISNVKSGSTLLVPPPKSTDTETVPSTVGAFALRPAVTLQLHLTDALVAFASPALSFSPKPEFFYAAIVRFELLFGLTYYL
ncbi:MAG TPA: tetratricopeptide repeat protein [Polyangia bacterium]|nr:tetratricopeptide repeat protein [Polyangia bacterium]